MYNLFMLCLLLPEAGMPSEPRPFHELNQDIRAALQAEVRASDPQERSTRVHRLCELYQEVRRDPRYATSDTLKKYRAKIWGRLTRIKQDVQKDLARQDRTGTANSRIPAKGGATTRDHGPLLVELITRTIAPEFWDTAGGPGAIYYYRPLRVLVVRATDDVHDGTSGLLRGLRR